MSDEDKDIDVESDEEYNEQQSYENSSTQYMTQAEKRAHHNALERKRRDHIKDSFNNLRDAVPNLEGDKSSRAQILKSATEYIQFMTKKNSSVHSDIGDLKRQNVVLEQQIRALERAKSAGSFAQQSMNITIDESLGLDDERSDESEDEAGSDTDFPGPTPPKKVKT